MFRKLTVLICLLSFIPAAAIAQEVAAVAAPAVAQSTAPNLSLPAERTAAVSSDDAGTSNGTALVSAPEHKTEAKHSSFNWSNFAEVHLGDYRWVWWAGAAAALIAIHAGAN